MKYIISLVLFFITVNTLYSQDDDLILGKSSALGSAALFDLSDPTGVNMEVNLWGFVRFPGRYRVPVKTTFLDVMTYAGGPTDESNLQEIRILRNSTNSSKKPELIKLNYDDLLWEEKVSTQTKLNPVLQPGDVIVVLREKRYTFRDDIMVVLPIVSTIVSVATLIVTITLR
jgi:hypothetical protein